MWAFGLKDWLLAFCLLMVTIIQLTQGSEELAIKRTVPTIDSQQDLENHLSSYFKKDKKLVIFLDFDGTLAELTDRPEDTHMTNEVEGILRRLTTNPRLFIGVISGRGLDDIKNKVKYPNITFGGNHGIQIENPDGSRSDFEVSQDIKDAYKKIVDELQDKVAKHGAWIEDKNASLTFHYAETPQEFVESLRNQAIDIIKTHGWFAIDAHFAIEGKPPVNWNKGEAVKRILQNNFGNDWQNSIKVIYIGDDTTDEDAMKALQGKGKTFRIAADPAFETYADFRLPSCEKTPMVLKWIDNFYA